MLSHKRIQSLKLVPHDLKTPERYVVHQERGTARA